MSGRPKGFTPLMRFMEKIHIIPNGCWEWRGNHNYAGYGVFWDGERPITAQRFSYKTFIGPIPNDYDTDHLCRNPCCVRPDHLEAVTRGENLRRGTKPRPLGGGKNVKGLKAGGLCNCGCGVQVESRRLFYRAECAKRRQKQMRKEKWRIWVDAARERREMRKASNVAL